MNPPVFVIAVADRGFRAFDPTLSSTA
eukprot:SAG22_NODE_22069_length_251_cov_2.000000_1_plen_26_part_10